MEELCAAFLGVYKKSKYVFDECFVCSLIHLIIFKGIVDINKFLALISNVLKELLLLIYFFEFNIE